MLNSKELKTFNDIITSNPEFYYTKKSNEAAKRGSNKALHQIEYF